MRLLANCRRNLTEKIAALVFGSILASALPALGQDGSPGITEPVVLAPFDASAPGCQPPPGLKRVLAYVQENDREFLAGVDHGLALAAVDRGLEYRRMLAENDAAKAAAEVEAFVADGVGAIVATSSDPSVIAPALQKAIWAGTFIGTIVPPPATLLLNAPQYETGKVLADAAIDYIQTKLGGHATVVLFTQDSMQYLAPRFVAMRDELGKLPGVQIIADITPSPVSKEGGKAAMELVLAANVNVDVVLGSDSVVLGALAALRETGKARPDQFLGGIDGEPEAVAEIKTAGSPYKASVALSSPVFGYAMGQYGADWLEGKSIPQAMDILPIALTAENLAGYEADFAHPEKVFADPVRRDAYLRMYGSICYETRDQYLNFPWSSEAR